MPIPSLWTIWPSLEAKIQRADRLILLLDYDGTLTPIVPQASQARLSAKVKDHLKQLIRRPGVWVALVSGRSLKDLKRRVGIRGLCYVGNHGLELEGPKSSELHYLNPAAKKSRPVLREIQRRLRKVLGPIPGVWVEDKGLTLSMHYRQADLKDQMAAQALFHQITVPYRLKRKIQVTVGKKVCEVRPPIHWTKGTVVAWLLTQQTVSSRGGRDFPIYAGDDLTDEDAFKTLGNRGITVAVGPLNPLTRARCAVDSVEEIDRLLKKILRLRKSRLYKSA